MLFYFQSTTPIIRKLNKTRLKKQTFDISQVHAFCVYWDIEDL